MLMDVPTGSAYLRVGQSTLRRWIAEGKLAVIRLGRRVLIRREALEELIERSERLSRKADAKGKS